MKIIHRLTWVNSRGIGLAPPSIEFEIWKPLSSEQAPLYCSVMESKHLTAAFSTNSLHLFRLGQSVRKLFDAK